MAPATAFLAEWYYVIDCDTPASFLNRATTFSRRRHAIELLTAPCRRHDIRRIRHATADGMRLTPQAFQRRTVKINSSLCFNIRGLSLHILRWPLHAERQRPAELQPPRHATPPAGLQLVSRWRHMRQHAEIIAIEATITAPSRRASQPPRLRRH